MKSVWLTVIFALSMLAEPAGAQEKNKMKTWRKLTPDEEEVIVKKGTERPFSGRFYDFYEPGVYVCRRCGAALYRSADKFKAKCGWPSFDAEIPGAVLRRPDADGQRTEILCAHCEAHLGHVFSGERLTPRNTRHCVNSLSMDFVPRADLVKYFERAIFAGGCFWGVEYYMEEFPGVAQTTAGYTGGRTERPSYEEVCGHKTGHAEAVEALYDPRQTSYEKLARLFFEIHDPTQLDRQGPDMGDQYRSNIFYVSAEQKKTAEKLIGDLKEKGWDVVTRLDPAGVFWRAEDYHQRYYRRNGMLPGCHRPEPRFDKGPEILRP